MPAKIFFPTLGVDSDSYARLPIVRHTKLQKSLLGYSFRLYHPPCFRVKRNIFLIKQSIPIGCKKEDVFRVQTFGTTIYTVSPRLDMTSY